MKLENRYNEILKKFKNKIISSYSVKALIVYGSYVTSELCDYSNLNIWVITNLDCKQEKKQYSLNIDGVTLNVEIFTKDFLMFCIGNKNYRDYYISILHKCELYYCVDKEIERLCDNKIMLSKVEKERILMVEGCYAVRCLRKASKNIKYNQNLNLGYSILLKLVNHIAKIEIAMANQYNGEYVEEQALNLNHNFFYSLYIDMIHSRLQIISLQNKLIKCNEYITKRYIDIFNPLIKWFASKNEYIKVSDINKFLFNTYGIDNNENNLIYVYDYLCSKKILDMSYTSVNILEDSTEEYNEITYAYKA